MIRASGLAVDLGGTKIAAARVENGKLLDRLEVATDGDGGVAKQLEMISQLLKKLAIGPDDKIGVAVAGRVDRAGYWYAVNQATLTKITQIPLAQELAKLFGRAVRVQNDAIAAAIGEHAIGAGRGVDDFAYVTVSTGVGCGIILNGCPLISKNGLAGHLGFTTSILGRELCGCGRTGTIESVASGRAIARIAAEWGHPKSDARAIFACAEQGAEWAQEIITQSACVIAELCANLRASLDIERVALGGGIGLVPTFLIKVQAALAKEPELFQPKLVKAELGSDAGLIGIMLS